MMRALTIRFGLMCAGVSALVILVNVLHAPPALAAGLLLAYLILGTLILANYCIEHEDEIPTREQRRRERRG